MEVQNQFASCCSLILESPTVKRLGMCMGTLGRERVEEIGIEIKGKMFPRKTQELFYILLELSNSIWEMLQELLK